MIIRQRLFFLTKKCLKRHNQEVNGLKRKHPELEWESKKEGFVIQLKDGGWFVCDILPNGCFGNHTPTIDLTQFLWEAKVWKRKNAALKAAENVKAERGDCEVCSFRYDETRQARVIVETLG